VKIPEVVAARAPVCRLPSLHRPPIYMERGAAIMQHAATCLTIGSTPSSLSSQHTPQITARAVPRTANHPCTLSPDRPIARSPTCTLAARTCLCTAVPCRYCTRRPRAKVSLTHEPEPGKEQYPAVDPRVTHVHLCGVNTREREWQCQSLPQDMMCRSTKDAGPAEPHAADQHTRYPRPLNMGKAK
jgi:hypothetical protein